MFARFRSMFAAVAIGVAVGVAFGAPLGVLAEKTGTFEGTIVHVSTENLKVKGKDGTILSFLLVPHFQKILHSDGKTTAQMSDLKPGDRVLVYYDQSALGARHADKIVDETMPLKPMKS